MKQAQELISKVDNTTNELKSPKKGKIKVETFEKMFKTLIEAEEYIYTSLPSHELNEKEANDFCSELIKARESIDEILSDFGVIKKVDTKEKIKKLSQDYIFITAKNSYKKKLNKLGIDVSRILVSTVPLEAEDMLIINPKMPEKALKGIDTKIQHLKNDINKKIANLNPKKIFLISEDDLNGQLLKKRMEEKYSANCYLKENIKDLSENELLSILDK